MPLTSLHVETMPDQDFRLILASQSPQRRHLLEQAGYTFEVIAPHPSAECGVCSGETPNELVSRLARQKAADVAARVPAGIVLACDTVAECSGQVLGKPRDLEHARQMLTLLSGQTHYVYSGLCLWQRPSDVVVERVDVTKLWMEQIFGDELQHYLDSDAWEGRAGAFGYQDGPDWLHIVSGSESNVIGLPMELLREMLAKLKL
ncbi:MAG: septum formation protein Maf [Planctomycetales bacterium]|nr:septum formation protein Maf [Planctomycetales bacterium]